MHGREEESADVADRIASGVQRWISLVGPGGVGKTTLAIDALDRVSDGTEVRVVVVDLGDVHDAARVLSLIEQACAPLCEPVPGHQLSWQRLGAALGDRPIVLLLDCVEHLRGIGTGISELLANSTALTVITTSRLPVGGRWERVMRVEPFALPVATSAPDALRLHPAVRIFVDAAAGRASVRFSDDDLAAIVAIADLVGGMPLSLELAGARAAVLSPALLLERLRDHGPLDVLSDSSGDRPQRQRDVRSTIAWTLDALDDVTAIAVRAACVFVGRFDADEWMGLLACMGVDEGSGWNAVSDLVVARLVETDELDRGRCFHVHPAVREVVSAWRGDPSTMPALVEAHDAALVALVAVHTGALLLPDCAPSLRIIERRSDDLLAAWHRAIARADHLAAGILASGLATLWSESSEALGRAPALDELGRTLSAEATSIALGTFLSAWAALLRVETLGTPAHTDAGALLDRMISVAGAASDEDAVALTGLGMRMVLFIGAYEQGRLLLDIGIAAANRRGDDRALAAMQLWSGMIAYQQGDIDTARVAGLAGWSAAKRLGAHVTAAHAALLLTEVDPEAARGDLRDICRPALQDAHGSDLLTLGPHLAWTMLVRDDVPGAAAVIAAALRAAYPRGQRGSTTVGTMVLITIAVRHRDFEIAARMIGSIERALPDLRHAMPRGTDEGFAGVVGYVQHKLGPEVYGQQVATGAALQWADAIESAISYADALTAETVDEPGWAPSPLTDRELQVVACISAGMTNKDIGRTLGISVKTAMHHTTSVYRKLGVSGRAEAAAWATRHGVPPMRHG